MEHFKRIAIVPTDWGKIGKRGENAGRRENEEERRKRLESAECPLSKTLNDNMPILGKFLPTDNPWELRSIFLFAHSLCTKFHPISKQKPSACWISSHTNANLFIQRQNMLKAQ